MEKIIASRKKIIFNFEVQLKSSSRQITFLWMITYVLITKLLPINISCRKWFEWDNLTSQEKPLNNIWDFNIMGFPSGIKIILYKSLIPVKLPPGWLYTVVVQWNKTRVFYTFHRKNSWENISLSYILCPNGNIYYSH